MVLHPTILVLFSLGREGGTLKRKGVFVGLFSLGANKAVNLIPPRVFSLRRFIAEAFAVPFLSRKKYDRSGLLTGDNLELEPLRVKTIQAMCTNRILVPLGGSFKTSPTSSPFILLTDLEECLPRVQYTCNDYGTVYFPVAKRMKDLFLKMTFYYT